MTPAVLVRVLRVVIAELETIDSEQRQARADWVDQSASPLGRKRHCVSVRRRLAAGAAGAAVVGRRHLLSAEALTEELQNLSKKSKTAKATSVADELRQELRLVGGR